MVYGIIELINFAHGDVFMLGLFISLAGSPCSASPGRCTGWQLVTLLPLVFVAHHADHRGAQRDHRPRRLPAAAPLDAAGPADHRHRRVVHAREHRARSGRARRPSPIPTSSRRWTSCASGSASTPTSSSPPRTCWWSAATIPLMLALTLLRDAHARGARPCGPPPRTARPPRRWASTSSARSSSPSWSGGALAGAAGLIQGMYYNIGHVVDGLPGRAARLHRRRPRRHRQHAAAPRSAASSSASCRRGATSTSRRAGPTPSSSRSSSSSSCSVPRASWASARIDKA